ncbi:MAG: hypothetical protein WD042_12385 [Phycisphaeraceae bacterium]
MSEAVPDLDVASPHTIGESHVEEICNDLACPACQYNLRGLRGAVVACPECGHRCDVAKLVVRRWTKPWYRAPGLYTMQWPVLWFVMGWFGIPIGLSLADLAVQVAPLALLGALLVYLAIWCLLMWRTWVLFGGFSGVLLALLMHAVLVGYLVGLFGGIIAGIRLILSVKELDWIDVVILVPFTAAFFGILWLARRGERWVAQRCIRRYLARE